MIHLSSLRLYPLKSALGVEVSRCRVDEFGLARDRRFMVVNADGRFMTQRRHPHMSLLRAELTDDGLALSFPGHGALNVSRPDACAGSDVEIWGESVSGHDAGPEVAAWLTAWMGEPCRLVYMHASTHRPVDARYAQPPARVSFADGYPFLLIGEASLADLNDRLPQPITMARFRPNLVVAGAAPFEEDGWRRIRIGEIIFDVVKPCARCVITAVDPDTATPGKEPLRTLATYRKVDSEVMFGQNVIHRGRGTLSIGDAVEVLEGA